MSKDKPYTHAVIHFSSNWVFDPAIHWCHSLREARQYLKNFKGDPKFHGKDSYHIVRLLEKGISTVLNSRVVFVK